MLIVIREWPEPLVRVVCVTTSLCPHPLDGSEQHPRCQSDPLAHCCSKTPGGISGGIGSGPIAATRRCRALRLFARRTPREMFLFCAADILPVPFSFFAPATAFPRSPA